jgi:PAS domain S-box-containing protein
MEKTSKNKGDYNVSLKLKDRALASTSEGITISDPSKPDNPLIYVNKGFEILTGYSASSVLGRNCRYLQGPLTNPDTAQIIRESIKSEKNCTVEILNYRKDGTTFWNRLSITPVRDKTGRATHFIGVQSDITARKEAEEALKSANEKMAENLNSAAKVQRAFLPHVLPKIENFEFAWQFKPCEQLAGDILNIIKFDEKNIAVYLLDVSGHGVSAALLAVAVSKLLSPASDTSILFSTQENSENRIIAPPKIVAERLNSYFQFESNSSKFFTMIYGVLNLEENSFNYVSAGHPPPILLSTNAEPVMLYDEQYPIGIVDGPEYTQRTIKLKEGDSLIIYTDGVTDAFNDSSDTFGIERLLNQLKSMSKDSISKLLSATIETLEQWCGDEKNNDDISILGFQRLVIQNL